MSAACNFKVLLIDKEMGCTAHGQPGKGGGPKVSMSSAACKP